MRRRFMQRNFGFGPREPSRSALDWRALAEAHRPKQPEAVAAEVRRLHGTGLMARDISTLLGIDLPMVLQMIQSPDGPRHE